MLLLNAVLELSRNFPILSINYEFLNLAFKALSLSATHIFFHLTSYSISSYTSPLSFPENFRHIFT